MTARTVLVAGTASHVGKSTVVAGLCRLLADRGVDVAPFKAQNMSNNARVVPIAGGSDRGHADADADANVDADADAGVDTASGPWGEIGVSQYVQARAARIPATTDHNPVLLKPHGDGASQLIVDGEAVCTVAAGEYYDAHWRRARAAAEAAHRRLAERHDLVVAEGAGSIAEINLHHRDLANLETVRFAERLAEETGRHDRAAESPAAGQTGAPQGVDVLLVADIDRGGVFASLVGTLELLPEDVRRAVAGAVITKFRGDVSLLEPGLEAFEERTGVPVLGVLPYDDPGLPEEDSVALPAEGETATWGDDDGVDDARTVTIAVPRFSRASNVTDVEPLARTPGVRVRFVPLDEPLSGAGSKHDGDDDRDRDDDQDDDREDDRDDGPHAVLLTGTKNTVDEALAAREAGLYGELRSFVADGRGPVVGICGGYQLLGKRLTNAAVEGTGDREKVAGAGLLPVETRFSPRKTVEAVERDLRGRGPLAGAEGTVDGYEIHVGDTELLESVARPFADEGSVVGDVLGTYLHGLFENRVAREAFVDTVYAAAGRSRPETTRETQETQETQSPYDRAADLVRDVDLRQLGLDQLGPESLGPGA